MPTFSLIQIWYETSPWCIWILNVTAHSHPLSPVWLTPQLAIVRPNRLLWCHYTYSNSKCRSLGVEVKRFKNCGNMKQIKWLTKLLCVARNWCANRDWCANIKYQNEELNNPAYEYQQDRQFTVHIPWHWGAFTQPLLQCKNNKCYVTIFWASVCSISYHAPYCHLCPLQLYVSFRIISNSTFFLKKKAMERKMFSTTFV
jgi:hypothetical protein